MWKLTFKYQDGGVCTVTNKAVEITPRQMEMYTNYYKGAESAEYQKYPKKDNESIRLW